MSGMQLSSIYDENILNGSRTVHWRALHPAYSPPGTGGNDGSARLTVTAATVDIKNSFAISTQRFYGVKEGKRLHSPVLISAYGVKDGYMKLQTLAVGLRLKIPKCENMFAKLQKSDTKKNSDNSVQRNILFIKNVSFYNITTSFGFL